VARIEDVELATSWSANLKRLRVTSLCWDDRAQRVQMRLECEETAQCLPFLAYVHRNEPIGESGRHFGHSGAYSAVDLCGLSSGSRSLRKIPKKAAIQTGDRATAVFQADGLRMTASVKCLERGSTGEVIRVRSQDGHIFQARILGPKQLEVVTQ
jgi:Chaperone for flagella basal body P-ring formation